MAFYDSDETESVTGGYERLEPGYHDFEITDVKAQETKAKQSGQANKGMMFVVETKALETGTPVTIRFNVENMSEEAQKIGRGQFKNLHESCGLATLKIDTDDDLLVLVGKQFNAETEHEVNNDRTYSRIKTGTIKPVGYERTAKVGAGAHGTANPGSGLGQSRPSQPSSLL